MRWTILTAVLVAAFFALPALAGDGHDHSRDGGNLEAMKALAKAEGSQCSSAIAKAEREVKQLDDGVSVTFRSRNPKVLERISQLAIEGRIFGFGPDGKPLPRRIRKERRSVTLSATSSSTPELRQIRSVASRLGGPEPLCGVQLAAMAPAEPQG